LNCFLTNLNLKSSVFNVQFYTKFAVPKLRSCAVVTYRFAFGDGPRAFKMFIKIVIFQALAQIKLLHTVAGPTV